MSFDSLGLSAELVRAVTELGYTEPTPIQSRGIAPVLEGRDLLAAAQTGTGKTAAFALPLLQMLLGSRAASAWLARAALPRARADPRTRGAGAAVLRGFRPSPRTALAADFRRRQPAAADRRIAPGRRHHHRDAGPAARSRQRAQHQPAQHSASRPRRSRSHARHGFHPRHPSRARDVAGRSARTCCSRRRSRRKSAGSRAACCTIR